MNESFAQNERLAVLRLNFRHLAYFWLVAKEGHLTRVAQRLHVSQSALSAQIRQLGERLGEPLFRREGRQLQLTETGRLVLAYCEDIFDLGEQLLASVRGQSGGQRDIRVGSSATLSRNFQENWLRPLLAQPGLVLTLQSGTLEELLSRLSRHQLDVVLSNEAVLADAEQPLRCRLIARQALCLVGPATKRSRRQFRFPEDLEGAELVLPGPRSSLRARFDALCESAGVRPRVRAQAEDMAMLRLLARDSGWLTLLPEIVVQDELRSRQLRVVCRVPDIEEHFYAITTRRRHLPAGLKALLS